MKNKILNFKINEKKNVSWEYLNNKIELSFNYPIEAHLFDERNVVVVIADIKDAGSNNLFVYNANGEIKINPEMPELNSQVEGVYTMFYKPNSIKQEVVLISEAYSPYDTACTFDIASGNFSNFHPTK